MALAIAQMTCNKVPGPDGVTADVFKMDIILWTKILANVLNTVCQQGLPRSWSNSIIVPVVKKGQRGDPRCYRPISLTL